MVDTLRTAIRGLRAAIAALDPDVVGGDECRRLASELATVEKACAAARVRVAARAAACGAHRRAGFADPADWLAREAGTTIAEAKTALDTAALLQSLPATAGALAAGELSLAQAAEIAKGARSAEPAERDQVEAGLLDIARHHGLRTLKDTARKQRLERIDPAELHRRQHRARYLRHWRDELGMVRIDAALPPAAGIALINRLDAETDRHQRTARRAQRDGDGGVEKREAYAADALVTLTAGGGKGQPGGRADLVIVSNINAYRRGHAHPGEVCHIIGGGPIPVDIARQLGRDAFLKAVLHDGVNIHTVHHIGRYRQAELRTALELGAPPGFDGAACTTLGCDRRYGLEWDHRHPLAAGGTTTYANLEPQCWPHHHQKTEQERQAGLYNQPRTGGDSGVGLVLPP